MIWLAVLTLSIVALAQMLSSLREAVPGQSRQKAALALHRAQVAELDRELEEGRIAGPEHAAAVLEVQRRILAASADTDAVPVRSSAAPVVMALLLVPMAAVALYMISGIPEMPAMPLAARLAAAKDRPAREEPKEAADLIAQLRAKIASFEPSSDQAREGWMLLGSVEGQEGRMSETADAWRHALAIKFDPTLAVETAEALTESNGGKSSQEAVDLFRRALDEAPSDAPWRPMAVKRLVEAAGSPLSGPDAPAVR